LYEDLVFRRYMFVVFESYLEEVLSKMINGKDKRNITKY